MREKTVAEINPEKNAFFYTTAIIKQSENLTKNNRQTDRK